MSSPQRDEQVVRYLEGIASDGEVAALEASLRADPALRREFVRLAHLQALFADLPPASLAATEGAPRWRSRALAAAGALAAALAIALLWQLRPAGGDGPTISALSGLASASRGGSALAVVRGDRLRAGDRLTLEGQAELTLTWPSRTAIIIAGGSAVVLGGTRAALTLDTGMLHATVVHDPEHPFAIATSDALVTDIGTAFSVQAGPGATVVRVDTGVVALANARGMVEVSAGASARTAPGQRPRLDPAAGAATGPGPQPAAAAPQPVDGALTASGTVTAVDAGRRSFTLRDGRTGSTSEYRAYFAGGHAEAMLAQIATLTVGEALTVSYLDKEGRRAVRIVPAATPGGAQPIPGQ